VASNDWAASALRWWQDAGVDTIVGEEPHDWLNPKPAAAAPGLVAEAVAAPPVEVMPDTLAAFQDWLLATASLPFGAPLTARVAPAGDPASGDGDGRHAVERGRPDVRQAGALFDRMMGASAAAGISTLPPCRRSAPRRPPDAASADALAGIARHHVGGRTQGPASFGDACAKA
jgi:DNA polymerase